MSRRQSRPSPTPKNEKEESLQGPTMNLAIVNVVMYVVTVVVGGNLIFTGDLAVILFGFSLRTFIEFGLIWTPLTSIFAHASIPHILGNMIFLFVYGFKLEERGYSNYSIYLAYLVTGILSTLLSAPIIGYTVVSLGASGSIFGLLGLNAGIDRRESSPNYKSVVFAALMLFILSSGVNTNIFAHLFGLIFGFILGNTKWFEQFRIHPPMNTNKFDQFG